MDHFHTLSNKSDKLNKLTNKLNKDMISAKAIDNDNKFRIRSLETKNIVHEGLDWFFISIVLATIMIIVLAVVIHCFKQKDKKMTINIKNKETETKKELGLTKFDMTASMENEILELKKQNTKAE